jgi:hypothetical protein
MLSSLQSNLVHPSPSLTFIASLACVHFSFTSPEAFTAFQSSQSSLNVLAAYLPMALISRTNSTRHPTPTAFAHYHYHPIIRLRTFYLASSEPRTPSPSRT